MKTKSIKLLTALISLLIGYAIVHSLSPRQEEPLAVVNPTPEMFEFNNDRELELECVYGNAPYKVHFSAYQQAALKTEGGRLPRVFCHNLPSLGATKITLDFIDSSLRDKSVALKFFHHGASLPPAEALASGEIISESVHNAIPRGLIQSRLDFSQVGFYTLRVEFGGGVGAIDETVIIPFEVGTEL
ncbi:MAG: hypothetical protein JKX92_15305 [Porticoccaceae bacterium]|nr:hypothetical protein [Porticoccaceae bacterium]